MTGEWDRLSADPSTPAAATLRASDADRDVVLGVLRDAYAEGRLDRAEYERRVEGALGVLVVADVVPLLSDLVAERRPPVRRAPPAPRRRRSSGVSRATPATAGSVSPR